MDFIQTTASSLCHRWRRSPKDEMPAQKIENPRDQKASSLYSFAVILPKEGEVAFATRALR